MRTEGSQGVHDEVDPQQLQHVEGGLPGGHRRHKGHHQRHQVDRQLELQSNAVKNEG